MLLLQLGEIFFLVKQKIKHISIILGTTRYIKYLNCIHNFNIDLPM